MLRYVRGNQGKFSIHLTPVKQQLLAKQLLAKASSCLFFCKDYFAWKKD
jgi:hypothetical protein